MNKKSSMLISNYIPWLGCVKNAFLPCKRYVLQGFLWLNNYGVIVWVNVKFSKKLIKKRSEWIPISIIFERKGLDINDFGKQEFILVPKGETYSLVNNPNIKVWEQKYKTIYI